MYFNKMMQGNDYVNWVKELVADDINKYREKHKIDYTEEAGQLLKMYLENAEKNITAAIIYGTGKLEQELEKQTGKRVRFDEIRRCAITIDSLIRHKSADLIKKVNQFAEELIAGQYIFQQI